MGGDFTREMGMRDAAQFGSMGNPQPLGPMNGLIGSEPPPNPSEVLRGQIRGAMERHSGKPRPERARPFRPGRGLDMSKPYALDAGLPGEK
jgi:hypothetical protein